MQSYEFYVSASGEQRALKNLEGAQEEEPVFGEAKRRRWCHPPLSDWKILARLHSEEFGHTFAPKGVKRKKLLYFSTRVEEKERDLSTTLEMTVKDSGQARMTE